MALRVESGRGRRIRSCVGGVLWWMRNSKLEKGEGTVGVGEEEGQDDEDDDGDDSYGFVGSARSEGGE